MKKEKLLEEELLAALMEEELELFTPPLMETLLEKLDEEEELLEAFSELNCELLFKLD
jgi:hypothetical protein